MHPLISFLPLTLFFLLFTCNARASADPCVGYDCLQEYVFRDDGAYSWLNTGHRIRVDETGGRGGWTGYFLNFTSQQWLTSDLVSRSEWWHILVVVVPDNLSTKDTTLLWIGSGGNNDPPPDLADYDLLVAGGIATTNKVVTAALFQVSPKKSIASCTISTSDTKRKHCLCRGSRAGISKRGRCHCFHLVRTCRPSIHPSILGGNLQPNRQQTRPTFCSCRWPRQG